MNIERFDYHYQCPPACTRTHTHTSGGDSQILLMGTKVDLVTANPALRKVTDGEARNLATYNHMLDPIETSAKDNMNIERAFHQLARSLKMKHDGLKSEDSEQSLQLNSKPIKDDNDSSCAC